MTMRVAVLQNSDASVGGPLHRGFSLVEMLIALALSLIVMAGLAALFSDFSRTVSEGRAVMEVSARLRNATWRLRQDLEGLTCVPAPLVRVSSGQGYFQVLEPGFPPPVPPNVDVNSVDDVLAFTTSSPGTPFRGRLAGASGFESPTAEVMWFCEPSGLTYNNGQPLYTLHRRQFLVAATPDAGSFAGNVFAARGDSDLSHNGQHANSLGDLSKPANRAWPLDPVPPFPWGRKLTGTREGEDVMLDNVILFDIRLVLAGATASTEPVGLFQTRDDGDPAAAPIRGIEIIIRVVNPATGQTQDRKVVQAL